MVELEEPGSLQVKPALARLVLLVRMENLAW